MRVRDLWRNGTEGKLMARRRVSQEVRVYEFQNHSRWAVRIDAGTHVFIGLYLSRPSRARPTPMQVEMYVVRQGLEMFIGYAGGEAHVRLARVFAALVDNRLLVALNAKPLYGGGDPLQLVTLDELGRLHELKVPGHVVG